MDKINELKILQNGREKNWQKHKLSSSGFLEQCQNIHQNIERRNSDCLSIDEFRMFYENANRPLVIKNSDLGWTALEKWSFSYFYRVFPEQEFKCGETPSGDSTYVKMKDFIEYLYDQNDDFPLYIFDDSFYRNSPSLLLDYSVPKYFPEDLFAGVKGRPPYRWLLIGPKRSGSCVHQDPLGTSAWNTSIKGLKLWVLFPPSMPKQIVKYSETTEKEPFFYFQNSLKKIQEKYRVEPVVFIQQPGETVFVPSKWWHAVLNLTDTIAVTQNFVSRCNFDAVWRMTRRQRKKFFERWKEKLAKCYPDLLERGRHLDLIDGYR